MLIGANQDPFHLLFPAFDAFAQILDQVLVLVMNLLVSGHRIVRRLVKVFVQTILGRELLVEITNADFEFGKGYHQGVDI